jgi:predicted transcriptional regulator
MAQPRLSRLELQIMETLWTGGDLSVREIQQALPPKTALAYTTVHTMVGRLEKKRAVRRLKKVGNAFVFQAAITRAAAQRRLIDELLGLFGGSSKPVMANLIEGGKLTMDDVKEAEQLLKDLEKKGRRR